MLIRIWQIKVKPDRFGDLEKFGEEYFQPMFERQEGCLGVLFTHDENYSAMISMWDDMRSIEKLRESSLYHEAVESILGSGLVDGEQSVEIFEASGGFLRFEEIAKSL